jgi:formylglycine-generating enzyme required for sulfatase activity
MKRGERKLYEKIMDFKVIRSQPAMYRKLLISCIVSICSLLFSISVKAGSIEAKVTSIEDKNIKLDIGSDKGVSVGAKGRIFYIAKIGNEDKRIYTAEFKIASVSEETCIAEIVAKTGEVSVGYLAELKMPEVKKPEDIVSGNEFTNSLGMKFVYIKPGTFMMGSPVNEKDRDNDETQHQVTLTKGYYIGVTEVTQGQWKGVMGNNPSSFSNCGDDCPVEKVSWNDVQEFISRLNSKEGTNKYRLPTEAEWEYACRAGGSTRFTFGDSDSELGNYAWYRSNSDSKTHPVASLKSNAWGLYDMHGNVWEWVFDLYEDYSPDSVIGPTELSRDSERVFRGGSWYYRLSYERSAYRYKYSPFYRSKDLGFRLARTP